MIFTSPQEEKGLSSPTRGGMPPQSPLTQGEPFGLQGDFAGEETRFSSDYKVLDSLGIGSYGKVLKCLNKLDGKVYAIKCIGNREKNSRTIESRSVKAVLGEKQRTRAQRQGTD